MANVFEKIIIILRLQKNCELISFLWSRFMKTKRIVGYAVFTILGFVLTALFSFFLIVRPVKIFVPYTPESFGLPAKELQFKSIDGTPLSGWLIEPPQKSEQVIILLHGYPASRGDMLFIARDLYPAFALFIPDLRYFGKSGGFYTTLGIKERADLKFAITLLNERGYKKIGVFGFSLGGAIALMTVAEDTRIKAVGAYASFADLKTLGYETYRNLWLIKYPLVELLTIYGKILFGERITDISPVRAVGAIQAPVFLAHSRKDEQIAFKHAEILQQNLAHNKKLETYFLNTGLHGELPQEFHAKLKNFFESQL